MVTPGSLLYKTTPGHFTANYLDESGALSIEKVFLKFQHFMKERYGKKDLKFVEQNGTLLFLAFIRPILNGCNTTI